MKAELVSSAGSHWMLGERSRQALRQGRQRAGFAPQARAPAQGPTGVNVVFLGMAFPHVTPVISHHPSNLTGHLPFPAVQTRAEPWCGLKVSDAVEADISSYLSKTAGDLSLAPVSPGWRARVRAIPGVQNPRGLNPRWALWVHFHADGKGNTSRAPWQKQRSGWL